MSRSPSPRIPEAKLKPFFDAINVNDFARGFAILHREEAAFPNHPYLMSYLIYCLANLKRWPELETYLAAVQAAQPIEIEVFNILRFGLKRTKYMSIVTDLMDAAYKLDTKRTDLLKLITLDHLRSNNYKRLQSLSSTLYTVTKENPYLIWSATALSLSFRQMLSRTAQLNNSHQITPQTLQSTPTWSEKRLKLLQDSTKQFTLIEALLKRAFPLESATAAQQANNPLLNLIQQQQNQLLKQPWFVQYLTLYTQHGLIATITAQMEKKIKQADEQLTSVSSVKSPTTPAFSPFSGLLDVTEMRSDPAGTENRQSISMDEFITLLPTFSAHETLISMSPSFIEKGISLLNSPLADDFKAKQIQQWRTLLLQYTMHSLLSLFSHQPSTTSSNPEDSQEFAQKSTLQVQIDEKIQTAKQLCRDLLKFWPDQWNIISFYVYLSLLEQTNGWYVFSALQTDPELAQLNAVLQNELKFAPHIMSLEPLFPQHNWYDVFAASFATQAIPDQFNITTIRPICIETVQTIKSELVAMWCAANTPQQAPEKVEAGKKEDKPAAKNAKAPAKGGKPPAAATPAVAEPQLPPSTDPSNFTGKYPSRGLLLALLEVDRLALIFNANISLRSTPLLSPTHPQFSTPIQQHITTHWSEQSIKMTQSILCTHFILDAQLYSCSYIEKPCFNSDLQFHLNVFSTFHALALIYPDLAQNVSIIFPSLSAFADDIAIPTSIQLFKYSPYDELAGEDGRPQQQPPINYPNYHQAVMNFTHNAKKRTKIHFSFAGIVLQHHLAEMEANTKLEVANKAAVQAGQKRQPMKPIVKITTWFDILLVFTNAFTYSFNSQFIIQDELTHLRRTFELDLMIEQQKIVDQQAEAKPQQQQQQQLQGKGGKGNAKNNQKAPAKDTGKEIAPKVFQFTEEQDALLNQQLLQKTEEMEYILLRPEIITLPYLAMPVQRCATNPPHTKLSKHPNAPPDEENRSTILHPHCLPAYSNCLSLSFAVHHEADLYLSKLTQIEHLFNNNNGQNPDKQLQSRVFFAFHQQYSVALQLLHSFHEHAQPTYAKQQEYQKQLQVYRATMNHLELPPPPTQPIIDEAPAQLGILALFFLLDIYSTLSLHSSLLSALQPSSPQVQYFKPFQRFITAHLPPQTQLQTAILSTLQYLQIAFPHEIQSQLLHFRLYSHPFGLNLIEIYRVFVQMAVKQIQWDTLSYLSPVIDGLNQLDVKIATILSKQVTQFHFDFAESDNSGYEGSFTQHNSFSTLSMAGLTERLLFSQNFLNSFITLALNEAVFISPVKLNHNLLIVDESVDIDFDLVDPVKFHEQQEAEKKKKEHEEAKKAQNAGKPIDKKAAIAAAQAAAKNKGKKPESDDKKLTKPKVLTNPHLPLHLQSLQLVHSKPYQQISAASIHASLHAKFTQLFDFFNLTQNKYLPTLLPHPSKPGFNVAISNPTDFVQLMLFVSNRHTNNDLTSLQCPTLLPSISTSIPSLLQSSQSPIIVHPPLISSLAQTVTPFSSQPNLNTTTSHTFLHPLLNISAQQYQPSMAFAGPPTPTCLYRDNATSSSFYNEYYFNTDEQSIMLRFKFLYSILLYFFSAPPLYTAANKGIFLKSDITEATSLPFNTTTFEASQTTSDIVTWATSVPVQNWTEMYAQTITDYYSVVKSTLIQQYNLPGTVEGESNQLIADQLKIIEFETNLMSLTIELIHLSTPIISLPTDSPLTLITSTHTQHISKINHVLSSAVQLLSIALGYFTPSLQSQPRESESPQNPSPDTVLDFTVSSLLHHHNYFERLVSLFSTYFVPFYILLAQRYQITSPTDGSDELPQINGFFDVMAICITYQTWYQNNLITLLELDQNAHFAHFTKYLSCFNKAAATARRVEKNDGSVVDFSSLIPALPSLHDKLQTQQQFNVQPQYELNLTPQIPLPRYLQAQQTLLVQHRLWNSYYIFESLIETLYQSHAALYVPGVGVEIQDRSTPKSATKPAAAAVNAKSAPQKGDKNQNQRQVVEKPGFSLPMQVELDLLRFKRTTHFTPGNQTADGSPDASGELSPLDTFVSQQKQQIGSTKPTDSGIFGVNFDSMNVPLNLSSDHDLILSTLQGQFEKAARMEEISKRPAQQAPHAVISETTMSQTTASTVTIDVGTDSQDDGLIDEEGNFFWDYDAKSM